MCYFCAELKFGVYPPGFIKKTGMEFSKILTIFLIFFGIGCIVMSYLLAYQGKDTNDSVTIASITQSGSAEKDSKQRNKIAQGTCRRIQTIYDHANQYDKCFGEVGY